MFKKISAIILSIMAVVNIGFSTAFALPDNNFDVISKIITKENLLSKEDAVFQDKMDFEVDGDYLEFTLDRVDFSDIVITNLTAIATGSIDFPLDTVVPNPENIASFDYFDSVLNRNIPVSIPLISLDEKEPFGWRDDFSAELIISDYASPYCTFNGKDIPHNQEYPLIISYENDYLNHLNLDPKHYEILGSNGVPTHILKTEF